LAHPSQGEAALWLGTQFRFPFVKAATSTAEFALDPQTRVNFRVGGVLAYIEDWDFYAEFVVNDRGELDAPATLLPILDGGFDQTFLVLGLTRRFRGGEGHRR
jgi:hypothetical protein